MNELIEKWVVERAETQRVLEGLKSGKVRIGNPWEGRAEAKIANLQNKIRNLDQLIETESSRGVNVEERRALALDLVTRGRAVVERQRLLIAEIRLSGADAADAEEVLASFEQSLASFEADLENIEDR